MTFNQNFMPPFNLSSLGKPTTLETNQFFKCLFSNIIKAYPMNDENHYCRKYM